ncbi:glycerol dehydrogenase [Starkeya sp. ORNL1]|uniref:glycerol dehydrogenase n=1 Tax=Starkeya sp. ORNL1 TaxID=2709380 RepID=UPI0014648BFE|nr:glycerol dehydrogenase [Starkeya sp. ORNL1]QJP16131.1 glycerol dehydrogenase [Starkeya sp. ORNL1]
MTGSVRIFGSPHRYVQGPGAIEALPALTAELGGRPVLVTDAPVWALLRERVEAAYGAQTPPLVLADPEITYATIKTAGEAARQHGPTVVIGAGGGKALDIAKGVAHALRIPVITVPTIASTDAPTSKVYVVYNEAHELVGVEHMPGNPAAVVVDTTLIAKAPLRFLLAGIGDAIAKKFEAEASFNAGAANMHRTRPLLSALVLAESCYQTLRHDGEAAVAAARSGAVTSELENVVEAGILMAGLAFENSGLSFAHAMTRGLSAAPMTARTLHGEQVAYALLVQLVLEQRTDGIVADLLGFYRRIGLPTNLRELSGAAFDEAQAGLMAERTMEAPHTQKMPYPVTAETIVAAMLTLEDPTP